MIQAKKIFVVVSVEDFIETGYKEPFTTDLGELWYSPFNKYWEDIHGERSVNQPEWFLKEETEPQYTFSKSELEDLIKATFYAAKDMDINGHKHTPTEYIQSIIK
jgi:hypothetical protein